MIVVAAGTFEDEDYEPLRKTPMILVTQSGEVPQAVREILDDGAGTGDGMDAPGTGDGMDAPGTGDGVDAPGGDGGTVTAQADAEHAEVVVLDGGESVVMPEQVLAEAARRGWRHVVLEGGPTLLRQWLEHDAVDELCLTVRPVLVGGDGPLVVPLGTDLPGLRGRATHLVEWDGDLLVRTLLRD